METTEQNPRKRIREWWKMRREEGGPIDLKAESTVALEEFMEDPAWCRSFAEVFGREIIYVIGKQLLQHDRGMARSGSQYLNRADQIAAVDREIAASPDLWARFMEHDRATGMHISLLEMTKVQLLAAAEVRADRGLQELEDAAFLRLVASKLKDGQIVNDVWSEAALTQLRNNVSVKFSYGLKSEKAKSVVATERKAA